MAHKSHRFSFALRSLFVVTLLLSVGLAWLHHETIGRVVLESQAAWNDFSSGSPTFEIPIDADLAAIKSEITAALDLYARKYGIGKLDCTLNEVRTGNRRFVKYDCDRWVRQRFDLYRWRYVLDYDDPAVRLRNQELAATIEGVARDGRRLDRR